MNTIKKGKVRCIVFREEATWFGVALEFNIVVEGDSAEVVQFELNEAVKGYIASLRKIKGTRTESLQHTLNQIADQEFETMWDKLSSNEPIPSPIEVKYYGVANV